MRKKTIGEVLPESAIESNILVTGPTLCDKEEIAFELLAASWTTGAAPFVITATDTDAQFRDRIEPFVPTGNSPRELYVIDCTEQSPESQLSCSVNSPVDLTGIGICLSKGYDEFGSGGRLVVLDTISTLLIYSSLERVYQFISKLNSRSLERGDTTVQLLDSDAIDTEDKNTLFQLFETVIEVRKEAEATLFRVHGQTESEWYEFQRGDSR